MPNTYRCFDCGQEISGDETRFAYDEPYCESCFDDRFTYCCRCDMLLRRDDVHWDNDGDPFCDACWEENNDDDSPENPEVSDNDRRLIIELCRGYISGRNTGKTLIKIRSTDFMLKELQRAVSFVSKPIYVYGLTDTHDYQISCSPDLVSQVKEYLLLNGLSWQICEESGINRLGISYSLRKNNLNELTRLIRSITKEAVCAV